MLLNIKRATLLFIIAYVLVTIFAYGISYAAASLYHLPSAAELGVGIFEDPAFKMTVWYHLLINLVLWVLFSWLYLRRSSRTLGETKQLALAWLLTALVVDLVCFVLIRSPYSLTFREFYIDYQPWIGITYGIVVVSPFVSYRMILKKRRDRI